MITLLKFVECFLNFNLRVEIVFYVFFSNLPFNGTDGMENGIESIRFVDLAAEWERILLLGLTHQRLPMAFLQAERDLGLAQYPEMFQTLVIRNDLLLRKRTSQTPIRDIKSPDTERALRETSTPL